MLLKPFLDPVWAAAGQPVRKPLQSLVIVRIVVVMAVFMSLAIWSQYVGPFAYWVIVGWVLGAVVLWSFAVLLTPYLQKGTNAELREILVDVAWVLALVFVAGRATNPFIYYYIVIVAFAAILLSSAKAWLICGLCVLVYSALLAVDVKAHFNHFSNDYKIHLVGMWVNFVGSSALICLFVTFLMRFLRQQQKALLAIRENHLKNEQLVGVATVSASTVHNLATPLSTLTLLIENALTEEQLQSQVRQDLVLMQEQIDRCRSTMKSLSSMADSSDEQKVVSVEALIHTLRDYYSLHYPGRVPHFLNQFNEALQIACSPLFQYALINLINNAIESALSDVQVLFESKGGHLLVLISNYTSNDEEKIIAAWGKPTESVKAQGLGIGSMLANSTIERQGGEVSITVNQDHMAQPSNQVIVTVKFPLVKKGNL